MKLLKEIKVADAFTIGNLAFGMISIFCTLKQNYLAAAIFIIIAGFMDCFDGRIARWLKQTNVLGKQLDSLADVISFGVAPAVLAFGYGFNDKISEVILVIFVICGMLRLARFNVQKETGYKGMPITINGLVVPLFFILTSPGDALLIWFIVSSVLMISDIKLPKI